MSDATEHGNKASDEPVDTPVRRAGKRVRPPNRRQSETRRIKWTSSSAALSSPVTIHVTLGYGKDLTRPVEIFYDAGYRRGSELDILCSDICIILSILLQHEDLDPGDFVRSLASERDLRCGDERFSSLVGLFLDEIRKPPKWAIATDGAVSGEDEGGEGEVDEATDRQEPV